MSVTLPALWAIDMHFTEPSTFGYAAAAASAAAAAATTSARGHFYAH